MVMQYQQIVYLQPLQYDSHSIEQVLMLDDKMYPSALFHIDFLWTTEEHRKIHKQLCAGETVKCEVRFDRVT